MGTMAVVGMLSSRGYYCGIGASGERENSIICTHWLANRICVVRNVGRREKV